VKINKEKKRKINSNPVKFNNSVQKFLKTASKSVFRTDFIAETIRFVTYRFSLKPSLREL